MKRLAIVVLAVFALAFFAFAGEKGKKCGMMEGMEKCSMHEISCMKGSEMKVTNTDKGVTIEVTSADKATVKKIQEMAAKMLKCQAEMKDMKGMEMAGEKRKEGEEMVVCPVMGTKMAKSKAFAVREYKGKKYYLCCPPCVEKFDKDPAKYAE